MFSQDVKNSALRVPPAVTQVDGLPPAAVKSIQLCTDLSGTSKFARHPASVLF